LNVSTDGGYNSGKAVGVYVQNGHSSHLNGRELNRKGQKQSIGGCGILGRLFS